MGCLVSTPADGGARRRRPKNIGEVAVFFPGLRIPKSVNFSPLLQHGVPKSLVDRLSDLRTRVAAMVAQEAPAAMKPSRKTVTRQGAGFAQADILQALEEYLPVLLGLVKDGSKIVHQVEFSWVNQVDDAEETAMANAWYEVLSVLHLMAMLCLLEANRLLLPKMAFILQAAAYYYHGLILNEGSEGKTQGLAVAALNKEEKPRS